MNIALRPCLAALLALSIQGCATLPPDPTTADQGAKTLEIPIQRLGGPRVNVGTLSVAAEARSAREGLKLSAPAGLALNAIDSITDSKAGGLAALLEGSRAAAYETGASSTVTLSRARLRNEMKHVMEVAQFGGFTQLSQELVAAGRKDSKLDKYARFLEVYFDGYFRKFKFINAGLSVADAKVRLKKDLTNAMNLGRPLTPDEENTIDALVKEMLKAACPNDKCQLVTADEKSGFFYNRSGHKFGFPTISISVAPGAAKSIDVTKIDEVALIADLTRVAVEALGDSTSPAVCANAKSTGCTAKLFSNCIEETDTENFKRLQQITQVADTAEAATGYVAAQVVRGAWFASLDNEAVAQLLQTTLSVGARKLAEERANSYYACPAPPPGKTEVPAPVELGILTIQIKP